MEEKEIHLRDYLRIINKRKYLVVTVFLIAIVGVTIKVFTAPPPLYRASTKVIIEKNMSDDLTRGYRYTGYDPGFLETQFQLIRSAAVAEKVVASIGTDKLYDILLKTREKDKPRPSIKATIRLWLSERIASLKNMIGMNKSLTPVSEQDETETFPEKEIAPEKIKTLQMVNMIKGGIQASPINESRVVDISYMSNNPVIAMRVVNSVADAYINELLDMQMASSARSISWMRDKAEIQRIKLEESEKELHDYKKKHDIITVENRLTVLPDRLSELSSKLTLAQARRKELEAVYRQVRNASMDELETIPGISEASSLETVTREIISAEQKISELSKKYGPKHPRMITAKNELENLNKKKLEELKKSAQTIKNKYDLARSNEQELKKLLDGTKFQAARLGEKSIQLSILQRKVDTNRFLYDALIKRMKEKGITEKSQTVNVWVLEKATLPRRPIVNKTRDIVLGLFFGLFGGIGIAFFLEYLDNTIKTPEDVEEKYNLSVLSTIGLFKNKDKTIIEDVLANPSSLNAENFKSLRTSLLLSSADNPPKRLLVTSMTPGEGKSSISICTALSLSQAGKSVLLIDADMRRPVVHKIFNIANDYGLSSILAGVQKEEHQHVTHHFAKNLDVIAAGPIPPNPSELLSSKRIAALLDQSSKKYDIIIIDTPPLISVTDPVILSSKVDGIIIVTWAGETTRELFGKGIKQLQEVSAPITGVVLNRFNAKKSGYYYNYGDYYYSSDQ